MQPDYSAKKAHSHLLSVSKEYNPAVYRLVKTNGILISIKKYTDLFDCFVRISIGQQLSSQAANSIWTRVLTLSEKNNSAIRELFIRKNTAALKKCGLSGAKVKALQLLKIEFDKGRLSEREIKRSSRDELHERIKTLWGFGAWSADMIAIFFNDDPDIWPSADSAVQKGFDALTGDCNHKSIEKYRPYRSFLAKHIWRGIDNNLF